MKKSLFARGITGAVASLLGVCAVGCSAGGADDGQIASQSQNLANLAPDVNTVAGLDSLDMDTGTAGIQAPDGRIHAASCVINDNGVFKMLVAGGYKVNGTSTLTATNEILAYTPSTDTWEKLPEFLQSARGELAGIQVPGDDTKCIFAGGASSPTGAASSDVDLVSANGASAFTQDVQTDMANARANFVLTTCNGKLYAIGGRTSSSRVSSIELSNDATATGAWSSASTSSNIGKWDVAFAKKPGQDRFLIAGGDTGTSSAVDEIVLIETTAGGASCSSPTISLQSSVNLTSTAEGAVAFPEGTTDTFLVAGGKDLSGTVLAKVDKITVSNWASTTGTALAAQSDLSTATYRPRLVQSYPVGNLAHMIIDGRSASAALGSIQQYQKSYGFHTASPTARFGGVAEYIDGAVFVLTGATISGSNFTGVNTSEGVNP